LLELLTNGLSSNRNRKNEQDDEERDGPVVYCLPHGFNLHHVHVRSPTGRQGRLHLKLPLLTPGLLTLSA
jgi:hypothetical protein